MYKIVVLELYHLDLNCMILFKIITLNSISYYLPLIGILKLIIAHRGVCYKGRLDIYIYMGYVVTTRRSKGK